MKKNYLETFIGAFVIVITLFFIWSFFQRNGRFQREDVITVYAHFHSVSGITKGADIKLGGVCVGSVLDVYLDEDTLSPVLELGLSQKYNIPEDSYFSVRSEGLMGGKFVGVELGITNEKIKHDQHIYRNESSLDFEQLISKAIFGASSKEGS